ncbi:MAG: NADAR family protein [Gammaproteobacteria bacterium]|nr:NADAR family protein [Gammaproteobacteria bacterium]MXY55768.1 NADAR family protein [Gammaproteobacteria bacterium]MYF28465.1 NADAR family protein [Gammaproteobacteria bacterium]MYK47237.1 NADAR family protein [Gammaproteobacteria bacterium]
MFRNVDPNAVLVSRVDPTNTLASYSKHGFHLDDADWPSVEHYYQAMKFEDVVLREQVRNAPHPAHAAKLARKRRRRIRKGWDEVKEVYMTRGTYAKCRTHQEVADALVATADKTIIETSQYDYYWGCGRDTRGRNVYGRVLTNVRKRLREESRNPS